MDHSGYAPVVLLHPPSCQRVRLRLVPPPKRRKFPALCACAVVVVALMAFGWARLPGPSTEETFVRPTVAYVPEVFAPSPPIALKPYVASVPALPSCSSDCLSYLVPR